jgi:uncharacterized protein YbjT (DUF2867 family)
MATALILGSTGLTGSYVLQKTLADDYFTEVIILVRKPLDIKHPKLKELVTDFKSLPELHADVLFSCLGTTKKKTPDAEAYRFIEVGIPVAVAKSTKGLQQFHYISAIGVGQKSVNSYTKNKWDAETELNQIGIPSVYHYRPSLIFGDRKEKRLAEDISNAVFSLINPLFLGGLRKYRRIHAETIAEAMIRTSKNPQPGNHIIESDKIQEIGG